MGQESIRVGFRWGDMIGYGLDMKGYLIETNNNFSGHKV